jgi:hypothetical protein
MTKVKPKGPRSGFSTDEEYEDWLKELFTKWWSDFTVANKKAASWEEMQFPAPVTTQTGYQGGKPLGVNPSGVKAVAPGVPYFPPSSYMAPTPVYQPGYGTPPQPATANYGYGGFAYAPQPAKFGYQPPVQPQYGGQNPDVLKQIWNNYLINTDTGAMRVAPGAYDYALSYENMRRYQDSGGVETGAMNRYGQPVGTLAPYGQSGGPSSPGRVTGSHMPAGYIGPNPNRGAFNKARAARRAKYKEKNPDAAGFGTSSAAAGGMAQWS